LGREAGQRDQERQPKIFEMILEVRRAHGV
jgi:hypothetical protein